MHKYKNILTERESQVHLVLVTTTLELSEVAKRLNMTERTVKFHRTNILRKLEARSRYELIQKYQMPKLDTEYLMPPDELNDTAKTVYKLLITSSESDAQIAKKLFRSFGTIHAAKYQIYKATRCKNRISLILRHIENQELAA